jgi:hypothetical protein
MSKPADLRSDETKFWHGQIDAAVAYERERCAEIALAIDSGRGNEKEISRAIRARAAKAETQP